MKRAARIGPSTDQYMDPPWFGTTYRREVGNPNFHFSHECHHYLPHERRLRFSCDRCELAISHRHDPHLPQSTLHTAT
ncbi:hypothetical protein GW17_00034447 [Ensete ventricosum]|nr:hypothetical protein GW17_00034447 [Ensete ventricosum]